ncbi:MAG: P27 family phage terminase small subunit [Streptosporangiales bacterium]
MPKPKKAAGTAVDKRNGQKLVAGGRYDLRVEAFPPPKGLSKPARDAWRAFWEDRQAQLLTPSSKVVLLRWVDALDRYLRTTAEADKSPLVSGSQGQPVVNPLYKIADSARTTMDACERQLGIGGLYSANLGLAAISEQRSLQEMNSRYAGSDDEQGEDEEDPRLRVVHGEVDTG